MRRRRAAVDVLDFRKRFEGKGRSKACVPAFVIEATPPPDAVASEGDIQVMKFSFGAAMRGLMLSAIALPLAAPAEAGVFDFLFGQSKTQPTDAKQRSGQRAWQWSDFSELRLAPIEPNAAANNHPINIQPEVIRQLLAPVRVPVGSGVGDEPLFGVSELADLLEPLHDALANALPNEDILLVSTSRRGGGLLTTPSAVTARVFVLGDKLNLIVHDNRFEFYGLYRGAGTLPTFVFGSRTTPSMAGVRRPGANARRADWLEMSIAGAEAVVAAPGVVPAVAPSTPAAPASASAPAAAATVPAAPATATPTSPSRARDPAFYEEQELRLRSLKRLHDNNLISEEEYQQKRRDILQQL